MIDFPASPTLNQIHTAAGRSWRWNGTVWQGIGSSGGGGVTSYNDLTDKPTLGTAAATSATDYATAAQGAKADTALQPSALTPYRTSSAQDILDAAKAKSTDVQIFYSSGTWTKPAGAKSVHVIAIAGGGGGASGRVAAGPQGGGGGAGGVRAERIIPASILGATESVTVGLGGPGGIGPTAINATTNVGATGGNSQFGVTPWLVVIGGSGAGLSGASGAQTNRGQWLNAGGGGGGSNSAGGTGGFSQEGGAGGGGGAGQDSTPTTQYAGGLGGAVLSLGNVGGTSAGGTAGGGNGTPGFSFNQPIFAGGGGGGGGSNTTGKGGNGGNGGLYGGGGGGGGCCAFGYQAGSGGNGANGIVVITTFF